MSPGLSRGRALDAGSFGLDGKDLPPFDAEHPDAARVDPRTWFAQPEHPLEIEIGAGKGTFLVQEAPQRPQVSFLGIERAAEFYRYAADRVRRHNLDNVRVLRADAVEFIRFHCASAVADAIHLSFSDPWPKKRHHKRRVIQDRTLADFHRVLRAGGALRLVTDHDALWAWYEEHAARAAHLFDRAPFDPPASAGPGEFVGTNFERKLRAEGHVFRGMVLVKR
jgi:tRNA (guanine-N7-)-methyltransferase